MKTYHESSKEVTFERDAALMTEPYGSRYKMDVDSINREIAPVDLKPPYTQVTMPTFQAAPAGTVFLVRSQNVPYLGDHFFMVTGPLVKKPHGLRPQGVSVRAGQAETDVLDNYQTVNGVIVLRLNDSKDIARFLNRFKLAHIVI